MDISRPQTTPDITSSATVSQAPQSDPYTEILSLARSTPSKSAFMAKVLRCLTKYFASPYAAVHVQYASEVLHDHFHVGPTDPKFWKASLEDFLTESLTENRPRARLLKSRAGDDAVAFLSAPVYEESGSAAGALAMVVAPIRPTDVSRHLSTLESLTRLASACTRALGGPSESEDSKAGGAASAARARTPIAALAKAAKCESAEELAFSITNELRNKLGCEQVAIGLVVRHRVKVLAVSGLDQISTRSPGIVSLTAAMEECLDAKAPLAYQREGEWMDDLLPPRYRIHKQWHAAAKGDAVASVPLGEGDKLLAVLSLRNRADRPFTKRQLEAIRSRVEPMATALLFARRASRGLAQHVLDGAHAAVTSLVSRGGYGRKSLVVLAVLLFSGFFFGSMPYRITVPSVVTPAVVRHVAAPYEGVLAVAYVMEGDLVRRGDVLCELDRRDINQQINALKAELSVLETEKDRGMAAESPVEVRLALAKQHLVRARLDIAASRARRATLRAPIDGIVVLGDLRKMIGTVVAQGDPLFELAPVDEWRIELEIPEALAADTRTGLAGVFASFAQPEVSHALEIGWVRPAAETRDHRNVFIAEADLSASGAGLLPGMEGVSRVDIGRRRVWWLTFHKTIDYLRMRMWL